MLKMTDTPIEPFLPIFASAGTNVAFLVPTPTGYGKSIMDATGPVRTLLLAEHIHDYDLQEQGPANKVKVTSYFVSPAFVTETEASLYRPI